MESVARGHAPGQPAEAQLVSLLACFEELLVECLGARSTFISGQSECVAGDEVLKVPAEAAKAWIRAMLSTPDQLQALDVNTLAQYVKGSEFFQDSHQVKVLCRVLAGRLFSTDAAATSLGTEQASAEKVGLNQVQLIEQLPTDLAVQVLQCAPVTFSSQLCRLPQSLSSLAALAAFPALAAACTLPRHSPRAAAGLPSLTLCVDVGQAGDTDVATFSSLESASQSSEDICAEHVAPGSIWVHYDDRSELTTYESLFSLQQRPHVVACPLLARSTSLSGFSIKLPHGTCLVINSNGAELDAHRVRFEGGAVVCMGSNCSATFRDAVFDKCTLVVIGGAQATLHGTQFKNMDNSEARLSVYAHGSGSQVHLHGGSIDRGIQGVAVQAAARLQASDLTVTGLHHVGLEVCGAGSMLTVENGTVRSFLAAHEVDGRFIRKYLVLIHQCGVHVHSYGSAQLSGVAFSRIPQGCSVNATATATLADCTVSDTCFSCVAVSSGSTVKLEKSTLSKAGSLAALVVSGEGSLVTATACRLLESRGAGALVQNGGKLIAHACESSGDGSGYECVRGVLELLNCTSHGSHMGCHVDHGHLTANNVSVTSSLSHGFCVSGGTVVLKGCSATGSRESGMVFMAGRGGDGAESCAGAEDCTVANNGSCGIMAMASALVVVRRCRSRENGEAGFWVEGGAQMACALSSSDGDGKAYHLQIGGDGAGVLAMEEVVVDGVVESCTLPVPS